MDYYCLHIIIKVVQEIKERIYNFIGKEIKSKLVLGTFYFITYHFLVLYSNYISIKKNFIITGSFNSLAIIKHIIK